jgi:hypothetical protein
MPRGQRLDLTGQRFGRLVVIERAGSLPKSNGRATVVLWRVKCDCGKDKVMWSTSIRVAQGCGCVRAEQLRAEATTHGETARGRCSAEYTAWKAMRRRCEDTDGPGHALYADRGIYVCARWRDDFAAFLASMGRRPSSAHSIDRINTDGSYTCGACEDCVANGAPANCRWATATEQQRNRRDNTTLTIDGETRLVIEWAEASGLTPSAIRARIARGWPTEHILRTSRRGKSYRPRRDAGVPRARQRDTSTSRA